MHIKPDRSFQAHSSHCKSNDLTRSKNIFTRNAAAIYYQAPIYGAKMPWKTLQLPPCLFFISRLFENTREYQVLTNKWTGFFSASNRTDDDWSIFLCFLLSWDPHAKWIRHIQAQRPFTIRCLKRQRHQIAEWRRNIWSSLCVHNEVRDHFCNQCHKFQ